MLNYDWLPLVFDLQRKCFKVKESMRQAGLTASPKKCAVGHIDEHVVSCQVHSQENETATNATCGPGPIRKVDGYWC